MALTQFFERNELVVAMRQRFKASLCPQSIPFDAAAGRALLEGRPLVIARPECPAALAYQQLAARLELTPLLLEGAQRDRT